MSDSGMLYKVLNENGSARLGTGIWHLPNGKPGKWMPKITGEFIPCQRGYHLCRREDLVEWIGPAIFIAEHRGEVVVAENKVVVSQARLLTRLETWNERTARLFACNCAEHILDELEPKYPADPRSREAIKVARRFARGEATADELAAARDAARDAVGAAARAAARDAARAAAWAAARDAARDAAWDAAWAAAWAAAWDAERKWQTARLFDYLEGRLA